MTDLLLLLLAFFNSTLKERRDLALENLALRQQLAVLKRGGKRPAIKKKDRLFWVWLSRIWKGWRECLNHVIVFNETHLRRILKSYFEYYHLSRTHLSLAKDAPEPRVVKPPRLGTVIEIAEVGGLHHRYERRAA